MSRGLVVIAAVLLARARLAPAAPADTAPAATPDAGTAATPAPAIDARPAPVVDVAPPPAAGPAPTGAPMSAVVAPPAARPRRRFPRLQQPSLTHADQFGIAVLPGGGYRVIAPYRDNVPCGQSGKRVCADVLPFYIEAQPSFGFAEHWDVIVDLRFGVVADFSGSRELAVAPGFRYWVDPDLPAKFFATIQGVYDLNPQHEVGVKDYDLAVRNANGFMFEVLRNLGFYVQFGETIGFVRWLRIEIDGGIGLQARFP